MDAEIHGHKKATGSTDAGICIARVCSDIACKQLFLDSALSPCVWARMTGFISGEPQRPPREFLPLVGGEPSRPPRQLLVEVRGNDCVGRRCTPHFVQRHLRRCFPLYVLCFDPLILTFFRQHVLQRMFLLYHLFRKS